MQDLIALLLIGFSVGLDNFAASIAIGIGGVKKSVRFRIAVVFGTFEAIMPIVGILIGKRIIDIVGGNAKHIGGAMLVATGIYLLISALRHKSDKKVEQATKGWGKLILAALSISIDNLIIGFGLLGNHQPLALMFVILGSISIGLALLGIELGSRLGSKVEEYSELLSGAVIILVGILIGFSIL